MSIVTIRGQLGSGASEIGKLVADRLHIDYVDREIIAEISERLKWSKQGIAEKEMPPGNFWGTYSRSSEPHLSGYWLYRCICTHLGNTSG